MISFFYNIGIWLFGVVLRILGLFNADIKRWNKDRINQLNALNLDTNDPVIWVHCASLGEYEQIQPLLKKIKESKKTTFLLLTFFSPSGYYAKQNSPYPNAILYLPLDIKSVMVKMVDKLKPKIFIGVKYEFWWNMLEQLMAYNTKIIYTNVVIQNDHYLFKSLFKKYKLLLQQIDRVFVQDNATLTLMESNGFRNVKMNGDMRVDNIFARFKLIENRNTNNPEIKVFVWGSIYPNEMKMINEVIHLTPEYTHYIVPHHVDVKTINSIQKALTCQYSMIDDREEQKIVIVNKIGILFQLYQKGSLAYVGGGMTGALHNVLESTISGLPTAIGPNHDKFPEANQLILRNIISEVKNVNDVVEFILNFENKSKYEQSQQSIKEYTKENLGATEDVFRYIQTLI